MKPGIYLVHKPEGPTSFSIVQQFMKSARLPDGRRGPRLCHGGTLDPFASGLLLILVEPATKLFDYLHAVPKTYDATVRWGIETDNGDPGGHVVEARNSSALQTEQLERDLAGFVGWREQVPHATSAKRIGGERAYLKAHRGEAVEMPASKVYLHSARWISHELPNWSRLEITARGGYYVRALVRDLGRLAGCGAHLAKLHRSAIGPWTDPGEGNVIPLHGRDLLPWLESRELSDQELAALAEKTAIPAGAISPPTWPLPPEFPQEHRLVRGFHQDKFSYLLKLEGEMLSALHMLRGGV
jgi:tRNA pseudouridine55 synthase